MGEPDTQDDPQRLERRAFRSACIAAGLGLSIYVGVTIFAALNGRKIAAMTAAGTFSRSQIHDQRLNSMVALEVGSLGIFLCGLSLVIYLMRWLSALRRRRREGWV